VKLSELIKQVASLADGDPEVMLRDEDWDPIPVTRVDWGMRDGKKFVVLERN
jgi:hypothetical protein